jgi:hypothetical protein
MTLAITTRPAGVPYRLIDPFRRPDWRFNRVLSMCDRVPTPGRCTPHDDEYVRRARSYLLRHRAFDEYRRLELEAEDEDLHAAFEIFRRKADGDHGQAFILEARILSADPPEKIAEHYSFGPRTIDYYEKLFFNVADRLAMRDWVTSQILIPALKRDKGTSNAPATVGTWQPQDHTVIDSQLDGSLKFFAYFAGPFVLERMVTGFEYSSRAQSPDEASNGWDEKHYTRGMKRRAAQATNHFEINKFNVMDVFMVVNQIITVEKAADAAEGAKTNYETHVKSLLDGLPWTVASRDAENVPRRVAAYDDSTSELRDDELLMVSAGDTPGSLAGMEFVKIPEGKPKDEILGPKAAKKDD